MIISEFRQNYLFKLGLKIKKLWVHQTPTHNIREAISYNNCKALSRIASNLRG